MVASFKSETDETQHEHINIECIDIVNRCQQVSIVRH